LLAEPENRFAFTTFPFVIKHAYKLNYRAGVSSIFEADEDLLVSHYGFVMHVALTDIIKLKASQFHEAGIFQYIANNISFIDDFKSKLEKIGPQVLTLRHLSASFVVICVLLSFSVVVFLAEFIPKLVRKLLELLELLSLCYVVVIFVRLNKVY
jgi:hypothetical protein